MDYEFKPRITVREIYEPGPYISSFLESKLSNHIGFNGFVELKDGNIILVKRGKRLSIGKRKWQQSIGASLKSGYCLDGDSHQFKEEGIYNSIKKEISDELKLDLNGIENNDIDIFAFYRDLVEGGKPQFLFYYKTDKYDKEDFQRNFKHKIKESKKNKTIRNKLKLLIDGNEFEFITPNELDTFDFNEYQMFKGDYLFSMTPSSIASILLFLEYLGYNKIKDNNHK